MLVGHPALLSNIIFHCRESRRKVLRWLLESFTYLLTNLINVAHWRGIWKLCDIYILPDLPNISAAITLIVGVVALMLMLNGNSLAIRCCEVDGDSPPEEGCYSPTSYLRYLVNEVLVKRERGKIVDKRVNGMKEGSGNNALDLTKEVELVTISKGYASFEKKRNEAYMETEDVIHL